MEFGSKGTGFRVPEEVGTGFASTRICWAGKGTKEGDDDDVVVDGGEDNGDDRDR